MRVTVKQGDTHDITLTVGVDLTGATVAVVVSRAPGVVVELASTVTDAAAGVITHTLTGTLAPGDYKLEVKITRDGVVQTAPTESYVTFSVIADVRAA